MGLCRALGTWLAQSWRERVDHALRIRPPLSRAIDFMRKWESDDAWIRGNFQGEVLGWVMMTAFLILATAGSSTLAMATGKWASVLRLLRTVDALGDVTTYLGKAVRLPGKAAAVLRRKLGKGASEAAELADEVLELEGDAARAASHAEGKADSAQATKHAHEGTTASEIPQVFRRAKKIKSVGAVSLKRLRRVLGKAGAQPGKYFLVKATKAEIDTLGDAASAVYGWVTRDGAGKVAMHASGRSIITFTPKGLSSLEDAVKSFGHETKHLKDFAAGLATSSEAMAEEAGEKLWLVVQGLLDQ